MARQNLGPRWHKAQLDTVDQEIARLCFILGIKLLDPGVIERLIAGDESICSKPNTTQFGKLRSLAQMHYKLTANSLQAIGPDETGKLLAEIRERLRTRFSLGGEHR